MAGSPTEQASPGLVTVPTPIPPQSLMPDSEVFSTFA